MSNHLINAAWEAENLSATQKIILVRLADRADADGGCFPGHESIAKDCILTVRSVQTALKILQAKGHLTINRKARRSNGNPLFTYTIHPLTPEAVASVTPENHATDTGSRVSTQRKPTTATPENRANPIYRTQTNQFNPQENQQNGGHCVSRSIDPKDI